MAFIVCGNLGTPKTIGVTLETLPRIIGDSRPTHTRTPVKVRLHEIVSNGFIDFILKR